ncbi:DNA gyrase inhibitor YacG [Cupriavidus sp. USMAA2-4]|uniref:DNA gyrase inhibitor YacG n=1 Tax=Cupriavidus malaysiensis TaxID=367825 RepID=A0ABN4TSA8_9BURK|nr:MULTISPECIES: DNA gyrase inhibitor YacG [Cupriavidus]AOY92681.1 DNA gyrase inhibitor YacG [Cupriavidus sp. USMAA2-4]AOZ00846.1 DNA gyrase inhibitor YacG [Cupriavidus sp. USMAHM13]AOZ07606.1 DNA gyrase inhibitor YacG [Cupriavidus malaysiensis]
MPTIVKCPTCGKDVAWVPESRFRPFCSERCKQIDLGAWAAEKYVIGGKPEETPSPDLPDDQDR